MKTRLSRSATLLFLIILACSSPADMEGLPEMDQMTRTRFNQYYMDGRILYVNYCSSCHMESGEGLKKAIPALAGSSIFKESIESVPCQIKYGTHEKGNREIGPEMVGFKRLSNLEIAEITTYISSSWGNTSGLMPVKKVKVLLDSCQVSN